MDGIILPAVLLTIGALAFFLEAFVPSGGLISVVGIACSCAALGFAFVNGGPNVGLVFLVITVVVVPASLISAFMLLPKTRFGRHVFLATRQEVKSGFTAQRAADLGLPGHTGTALSTLRPAGKAVIDGQRYDVMTQGEMIQKGATIEVRRVEGNRIVVREVRDTAGAAS
jgi:membrane-bound serine protease (ClpP class)